MRFPYTTKQIKFKQTINILNYFKKNVRKNLQIKKMRNTFANN